MLLMETAFRDALEKLLKSHGMTRYRLAADAGISQSHMTHVANADRVPTAEIIEKLATVFDAGEIATLQEARARDLLEREGLSGTKALGALLAAGKVSKGMPTKATASNEIVMEPIDPASLKRIPVYGDVSCGWGAFVEDEPIGWEVMPDFAVRGVDHAIKVRGDSMTDVGFGPDTLVFVAKVAPNWRKTIPSGKKVIARFKDDGSYTCKILTHVESGRDRIMMLQGAGPGFNTPLSEFTRAFEVVGLVVGSFRPE
jgi:SOS-response transcriptional repressor LexA